MHLQIGWLLQLAIGGKRANPNHIEANFANEKQKQNSQQEMMAWSKILEHVIQIKAKPSSNGIVGYSKSLPVLASFATCFRSLDSSSNNIAYIEFNMPCCID